MVKKTSKAKNTATVKKVASKKTSQKGLNGWFMPAREASTLNDVKTAILIVSLSLNVIALIIWLILALTNEYDTQLANFFLNR